MRFASLLFALISLSAGQAKQVFTGTITDGECANADHSHMRMGPTDAECVKACIEDHGASYVLYDGKNAYTLSDAKKAAPFAAVKVKVTGTLDSAKKTIQVDSIEKAR